MTSIIRDRFGRYVPLVQPKKWSEGAIRRSRDRTDRISQAKAQHKARLTTTEWMNSLDSHAVANLEADGIPWAAVQRWLDESHPSAGFASRMFIKQVLLVLRDPQASSRERFEIRRELYRRLIAAQILD